MSAPKYTPGPWHFEQGKLGVTLWAEGRIPLAKMRYPGAGQPCGTLADARLMVAAPDMFEALRATRDRIHSDVCTKGCCEECIKASEAINTALGVGR